MTFKEYLNERCRKIAEKRAEGRALSNPDKIAWHIIGHPTMCEAKILYDLLDYLEENCYEESALDAAKRLWRAYEKARARAATPRITYNHSTMVSPEVRADLTAQGYAVMHRGNGRYWAIKRDSTFDAKMLALLAEHSKKMAAD